MIDQTSQFFAILTNVGAAKQANANALGIPWKITEMGVGDANGTDPIPSAAQTSLINEWRRRPLNQLLIDPSNPAVLIAEQVIPPDEGGFWIREIGLYDADGDLVAVANCAPSFKPLLPQGSTRTQVVRVNFIVSSTTNVTLKIDPSIVLATREFVTEELARQDFKHSVLVATTANIVLSGLQTIDGVPLVAGASVLVKNQTESKDNGLYLVAPGAWSRRSDANTAAKVTPGLLVLVEKGTLYGDSAWQLVTDGPITLGSTPLAFEMAFGRTGVAEGTYRSVQIDKYGRVVSASNPTTAAGYGLTDVYTKTQVDQSLGLKADLNSPAFTGVPTAPTAAAGTNSVQIANAAFVQAAIARLVDSSPTAMDTLKELAAALGNDPNFATTVLDLLATKAPKSTSLDGYGIADALKVKPNYVSQQFPIISAPTAGVGAGDSAMLIREAQQVGTGQSSDSYAPAVGFYWNGVRAGRLIMDALGLLKWNGVPLLTGTVATQLEVDQGSVDTAVVTPRKLRFGFAASFTPNGYLVLPTFLGGFVFQWGTAPNSAIAGSLSNFTIPFPTKCLCIVGSPFANLSSNFESAEFFSVTETGFYSANSAARTNSYFAIGY